MHGSLYNRFCCILSWFFNEIVHAYGYFSSILNEQVRYMFDEIDYILEGEIADCFTSLYDCDPCMVFHGYNYAILFLVCIMNCQKNFIMHLLVAKLLSHLVKE